MSSTDNETTATTKRRWNRPIVWIALAVVGVAIVAAVGFAASRLDNSDDAAPPPPPPPINTPSVPSGDPGQDYLGNDVDVLGRGMRIPADPNGHVLDPGPATSPKQLTSPVRAPQGLEWQKVYGVPMPFSTSDGPTAIRADGVPSGFSRTPQGAALASLQILLRATFGPQKVRQAVVDSSVIGPADLKQQMLAVTNDPQYQTMPAAVQITPDRYTENAATIRWAFGPFPAPAEFPTTNGTVYGGGYMPVVWDDGRWKLRITEQMLSTDQGLMEYIDNPAWSTWF
ncbi:hypothetical protein [Gordonia sp. IITR100]|uniref:hypothetical protein n=1 Tax=Gordonia sp. IITR100 TaxID=1314686 RepID=UPI0009910DA9|nr:hypothetical protein [Gordonia sp. IITR100]